MPITVDTQFSRILFYVGEYSKITSRIYAYTLDENGNSVRHRVFFESRTGVYSWESEEGLWETLQAIWARDGHFTGTDGQPLEIEFSPSALNLTYETLEDLGFYRIFDSESYKAWQRRTALFILGSPGTGFSLDYTELPMVADDPQFRVLPKDRWIDTIHFHDEVDSKLCVPNAAAIVGKTGTSREWFIHSSAANANLRVVDEDGDEVVTVPPHHAADIRVTREKNNKSIVFLVDQPVQHTFGETDDETRWERLLRWSRRNMPKAQAARLDVDAVGRNLAEVYAGMVYNTLLVGHHPQNRINPRWETLAGNLISFEDFARKADTTTAGLHASGLSTLSSHQYVYLWNATENYLGIGRDPGDTRPVTAATPLHALEASHYAVRKALGFRQDASISDASLGSFVLSLTEDGEAIEANGSGSVYTALVANEVTQVYLRATPTYRFATVEILAPDTLDENGMLTDLTAHIYRIQVTSQDRTETSETRLFVTRAQPSS